MHIFFLEELFKFHDLDEVKLVYKWHLKHISRVRINPRWWIGKDSLI